MKGELKPRDCTLCECQQWRWDGRSFVLVTDPPSHCVCGHLTSSHVFRPEESDGGR